MLCRGAAVMYVGLRLVPVAVALVLGAAESARDHADQSACADGPDLKRGPAGDRGRDVGHVLARDAPEVVPGIPGTQKGRGQHEAAPASTGLAVPGQALARVPGCRASAHGPQELLGGVDDTPGRVGPQDDRVGLVLGPVSDLANDGQAMASGSGLV